MKEEEYSRSIKFNETQNNEYDVVCERCIYETKHKVLFSVEDNVSNDGIDWHDAYQIIQCQGCQTISFRKGSTSTDDLNFIRLPDGKTTIELEETETLYPLRIINRKLLFHSYYLPKEILRIYKETNTAIRNNLPTLSSIGMRALIEAVCKEKDAIGNNLKEKIDCLVKIGTITQDGADILHTVRDIGNESAHEIKQQDEDTINIAMDIIENVLQTVYILPRIAERIKK